MYCCGAVMLAAAVLTLVTSWNCFDGFLADNFSDEVTVIDDWQITRAGQPLPYERLPLNVAGDEPLRLSYSGDALRMLARPGDVLYYCLYYNDLEVWADDLLAFRYPSADKQLLYGNDTPQAELFIPLDMMFAHPAPKTLTLVVFPAGNHRSARAATALVGDKGDILMQQMRRDMPIMLLDTVVALLGIMLLIACFLLRRVVKSAVAVWLGLFLLCYVVWDATFIRFVSMVFPREHFTYLLSYITYGMLYLVWLGFAYYFNHRRYRRTFTWLCCGSAAVVTLCWAMHVLSVIDYHQSYLLLNLCIGSGTLFTLSLLAKDYRSFGDMGRYSFIGSVGLAVCVIVEIGSYMLLQRSRSGLYVSMGLLFFTLMYMWEVVREMASTFMLKNRIEVLEQAAYHDPLTGCLNRRAFERDSLQLQQQAARGARTLERVMAVMLDSNNLKTLNDTRGHTVGDAMLVETVRSVERHFRKLGALYRMGGDEFVLLLDCGSEERFEHACQCLHLFEKTVARETDGLVDVSIGAARFDPALDRDIMDMLRRAEKKMYQQKRDQRAGANDTGEESPPTAQATQFHLHFDP